VIFEPKFIFPLNVSVWRCGIRERFRIIDDFILIMTERSSFLPNLPSEPIMPTFKAIVWSRGIAVEVCIVDSFEGFGGQPSSFLGVHMKKRGRRIKHLSITVEDDLEVGVNFRDAEEESTVLSVQEVNYDCIEGNSDDVRIFKFGRSLADGRKGVQKLFPSVAIAYSWSWFG
jgi:hypothetical protein